MLKRAVQLFLVACLVAGVSWGAYDPFVGEWKLDPSRSKLTYVMKVSSAGGNKYAFDFGAGNETIVADGTDQPGYSGTTLSVTVEGPHTWKVVRKEKGHVLLTGTWDLSDGGTTLRDNYTEFPSDGSTSNVIWVYKRTGSGSGFAATWVGRSETINLVIILQVRPYESDGLSFIISSQDYTTNARFDGQDHPSASGRSATSARRTNAHGVEISYKVTGKVVETRDIKLSSDLKTLTMTVHTAAKPEPDIYVFERQ
jgi:hypothetical protein